MFLFRYHHLSKPSHAHIFCRSIRDTPTTNIIPVLSTTTMNLYKRPPLPALVFTDDSVPCRRRNQTRFQLELEDYLEHVHNMSRESQN